MHVESGMHVGPQHVRVMTRALQHHVARRASGWCDHRAATTVIFGSSPALEDPHVRLHALRLTTQH